MRKLISVLIATTAAAAVAAAFVDSSAIRAGDLWVRRDKGYVFVDDKPIPGNEKYFKAFEPATSRAGTPLSEAAASP